MNIDLICEDICNAKIEKASMVILNLTLQFIRQNNRAELLKKIYDGMIVSGVLFLISYTLILIAFVDNNTAYVVSFRQLSIVLTAILSMIFIEKRFSKIRLAGVIAVFAGVIIVAFF